MNFWTTVTTTGLAAAVEVIEMVLIVVGVGSVRGWRSTLIGTAAGFVLLIGIVVAAGTALNALPIDTLRLFIGALLLVFGLQWLRKGIRRVAANGFAGTSEEDVEEREQGAEGIDWTSFVLAFKGVVLEGLEISFIVVSFGATSGHLNAAVIGAVAAVVVLGVVGAAARGSVQRIPRSVLQLVVGTMLASFGTYWSALGAGASWPGDDWSILALLVLYVIVAIAFIRVLRRGRPGAGTSVPNQAPATVQPAHGTPSTQTEQPR
jgi:uncharacterized membrane protein